MRLRRQNVTTSRCQSGSNHKWGCVIYTMIPFGHVVGLSLDYCDKRGQSGKTVKDREIATALKCTLQMATKTKQSKTCACVSMCVCENESELVNWESDKPDEDGEEIRDDSQKKAPHKTAWLMASQTKAGAIQWCRGCSASRPAPTRLSFGNRLYIAPIILDSGANWDKETKDNGRFDEHRKTRCTRTRLRTANRTYKDRPVQFTNAYKKAQFCVLAPDWAQLGCVEIHTT